MYPSGERVLTILSHKGEVFFCILRGMKQFAGIPPEPTLPPDTADLARRLSEKTQKVSREIALLKCKGGSNERIRETLVEAMEIAQALGERKAVEFPLGKTPPELLGCLQGVPASKMGPVYRAELRTESPRHKILGDLGAQIEKIQQRYAYTGSYEAMNDQIFAKDFPEGINKSETFAVCYPNLAGAALDIQSKLAALKAGTLAPAAAISMRDERPEFAADRLRPLVDAYTKDITSSRHPVGDDGLLSAAMGDDGKPLATLRIVEDQPAAEALGALGRLMETKAADLIKAFTPSPPARARR